MPDTKSKIINALNLIIDGKLEALKATIADVSDSMKNDTKSSAGDKFETGREMMQIELNNKHVQLNQQLQLKKDLSRIDVNASYSSVEFGSLVLTNKGNYFISVALGKVSVDDKDYFALSLASPIGQALKGTKAGDEISFNKQNIVIEAVF